MATKFYTKNGPYIDPFIYLAEDYQDAKERFDKKPYQQLSINTAARLLFWSKGIDIFVLPLWKENDKNLLLKGYTYLISKSYQYAYDSWHKLTLNALIDPKNGKKSLAPSFPSYDSALENAIKKTLHTPSLSDSNEGYIYSVDKMTWRYEKIPHYTPYMVTLDENARPNALYEFNEDKTYVNVLDRKKSGQLIIQHENFFLQSSDKEMDGTAIYPITREELAEEIKKELLPQDEF